MGREGAVDVNCFAKGEFFFGFFSSFFSSFVERCDGVEQIRTEQNMTDWLLVLSGLKLLLDLVWVGLVWFAFLEREQGGTRGKREVSDAICRIFSSFSECWGEGGLR